jgi:hypothetical protein
MYQYLDFELFFYGLKLKKKSLHQNHQPLIFMNNIKIQIDYDPYRNLP